MKTTDYIDAIKRAHALKSDYKAAKMLGVTPNQIGHYRNRGVTFSDAVSIKAAELLGVSPGQVMADIHAERASAEPERQAWRKVAECLRGIAALLLVFVVAGELLPAGENWAFMSAAFALPLDERFYTLYAMAISVIGLAIVIKPLIQLRLRLPS